MTEWRWAVDCREVGLRLDKFLAAADRLGSRGRALAAIQRGKVSLNGLEAQTAQAATPLAAGDVVRVWMDRPGSATRSSTRPHLGDLHILYEDDELMVVNKPAGLLAVPLQRKGDVPSAYDQL
jgi:23S rRNA pseudouridine1911/1915/1917 synthase